MGRSSSQGRDGSRGDAGLLLSRELEGLNTGTPGLSSSAYVQNGAGTPPME